MKYALRKALYGLSLILGVSLISFVLMVWYGPDQTYNLIGKNASAEQIAEVRSQLAYDQPFLVRYGHYLQQLITLDLGHSTSSGESVNGLISRTLPISLALVLPGFLLGNLFGIGLGLWSARHQDSSADRLVNAFSIISMSLSFLIIIIVLQLLLSTPYGFNLFPVRGWQVSDPASYFQHVAVPTLALILVTLGYNTRFFRAVFIEEYHRDHIRAARAFATPESVILWKHVLKNSLVPIITRLMFSIPLIVISGSLLIETYFGVPGIGKATFEAISNGDQPVLKAVVGLAAVAFVILQFLTDLLYRLVDPRVAT